MPENSKPQNRQRRIDEIVIATADIYQFKVSNVTLDAFNILLAKYDIEDVQAAFTIWLGSYGERKFDFFPRPNQIIEIIENQLARQRKLAHLRQSVIPEVIPSPQERERNKKLIAEWKKKNLPRITKRVDDQMTRR